MSLADMDIIKKNFLNKDTTPLYKIVEITVPQEIDKWFFSIIEDKVDEMVNMKAYFDCWINKIQIIQNTAFLDKLKTQIYNITKHHKKLDDEINFLVTKSEKNLELIFKKRIS
jgi:hypothetical protein